MISDAERREPAHLTAQALVTAPPDLKLPQPNAFAFELSNVRSISGQRTLIGMFDVTLRGVVIFDCRLHLRKNGCHPAGPGRYAAWLPEKWQSHATFDHDLAIKILEAAEARLAAEDADAS